MIRRIAYARGASARRMAGETEVIDVRLTGPVKVEGEAWSDVEAEQHPDQPVAGGRSLAFVVDKPAAYGGGDAGMMPSEYCWPPWAPACS